MLLHLACITKAYFSFNFGAMYLFYLGYSHTSMFLGLFSVLHFSPLFFCCIEVGLLVPHEKMVGRPLVSQREMVLASPSWPCDPLVSVFVLFYLFIIILLLWHFVCCDFFFSFCPFPESNCLCIILYTVYCLYNYFSSVTPSCL